MNVDITDYSQTPPPPPQSSRRRYRWIAWSTRIVVTLGVAVIGIAIASALLVTAPTPPPIESQVARQQVIVFTARTVPVQRQWRGYGVVGALRRADVPARVAATVESIAPDIKAGRTVTTETIIVQLDDSDFVQQLKQANQRLTELDALYKQIEIEATRYAQRLMIEKEDVQLAQNEVSRIAGLVAENAAKQFELDTAQRMLLSAQRAVLATSEMLDKIEPRKIAWQANYDAQVAARDLAKQNQERCTIRSPIAGVLSEVDVKLGESVQPGQRVARVVNLERVEVPVQLPTAARTDIAIGGNVLLEATNETGQCWDATVVRLSPEDDADTRTMTAYVEVDQRQAAETFGTGAGSRLLMPGMFISAAVSSQARDERWVVPRRSLRAGRILVVEDNTIVSRSVRVDYLHEGPLPQLGLPDDQWAVLQNDPQPLSPGDMVVVNASIAVREGDKVEPVK